MFVGLNDARARFEFLAHQIAENRATFFAVVIASDRQLVARLLGHDRQSDDLRVRMVNRGARRRARIAKRQDVAEPRSSLDKRDWLRAM